MRGAGELSPKEFDGETRFRSYALRTSQTIKKIINIVPTTPYPSIVASSDSKILGFRIPTASSLNHVSRGICPIRDIIPLIRGVLPGKALSAQEDLARKLKRWETEYNEDRLLHSGIHSSGGFSHTALGKIQVFGVSPPPLWSRVKKAPNGNSEPYRPVQRSESLGGRPSPLYTPGCARL